jgi:hypothetical protein
MNFTDLELTKKRSFYTQSSNFGASCVFSVDSLSERYEFGVSGFNKIAVSLESGLVKYGDLVISSYKKFNQYLFELQATSGTLNLRHDGADLAYGVSRPTGYYNYVYFSRFNTGANAEFEFLVSGGNEPVYEIDSVGYLLNESQEVVTGRFSNNGNYDFKIFNSFANNLQNLDYSYESGSVAPLTNKKFNYSGDFTQFDTNQPIATTFYTNFGDAQVNFKIVNISSLDRAILLGDIESYSFNDENIINRNLSYVNYSGGVQTDSFSTELIFKLSYLGGSGRFVIDDFTNSASFTGLGIGNFSKSGIVTGQTNIVTGDSTVSGIYSVSFSRFQWATGFASGLFSGNGVGIASGNGYTGLAYGAFTGQLTGIIQNGSGTLLFLNQSVVGVSVGQSSAVGYSAYQNATGFINLSGVGIGQSFFIGIESEPIVNSVNYYGNTGLVSFLNQNTSHKVSARTGAGIVLLESIYSGANGNGIFVRNNNCNLFGPTNYSPFLTGGINFGSTGSGLYSTGQLFTGTLTTEITGSGGYTLFVSGNEAGTFTFERTFTGAWSVYTGLNEDALQRVPVINDSLISGAANLSPNGSLVFQINHSDSQFNTDTVLFSATGQYIINPINQIISQ